VAHPQVPHPRDLYTHSRSQLARVSEWVIGHLAFAFGATIAVWVFLIAPLVVLTLPAGVQSVAFFLASGWIQLWALPLLTYIGNKADQARTAKADADHQALTSVHTTVDTVALAAAAQDARLARIEAHLGIPLAGGP
jgi:hypothetical protein